MKTLVGQLDILETMTPMSFSAFRDRLDTASGFQSYQFRELEFVLGLKRPQMLKHAAGPSRAGGASRRGCDERSVIDHFYDFLAHQGVAIPRSSAKPETEAAAQRGHPARAACASTRRAPSLRSCSSR